MIKDNCRFGTIGFPTIHKTRGMDDKTGRSKAGAMGYVNEDDYPVTLLPESAVVALSDDGDHAATAAFNRATPFACPEQRRAIVFPSLPVVSAAVVTGGGGDDDFAHSAIKNTVVDCAIQMQHAVALPSPYVVPNTDERDAYETRVGSRRGQAKVAQEVANINRHNRLIIPAINNMHERQIDAANQKAAWHNFREENGLTQTSATTTLPMDAAAAATAPSESRETTTAPEFYAGTYGKEYQVSEYTTSEYTTTEYETMPYKSVYE
jgi:hypothetical protein